MRNRVSWEKIFGMSREGRTVRVEKVKAYRAVYIDKETSRVEMEIQIEGGERIILDFNTEVCANMVRQLTNVHDAIHPPLRNRTQGGM